MLIQMLSTLQVALLYSDFLYAKELAEQIVQNFDNNPNREWVDFVAGNDIREIANAELTGLTDYCVRLNALGNKHIIQNRIAFASVERTALRRYAIVGYIKLVPNGFERIIERMAAVLGRRSYPIIDGKHAFYLDIQNKRFVGSGTVGPFQTFEIDISWIGANPEENHSAQIAAYYDHLLLRLA